MTRFSVAVDEDLVQEVKRLSGARTKREAFDVALTEYVRRKRLEQLAELAGSGLLDMTPEELDRWRAGAGEDA